MEYPGWPRWKGIMIGEMVASTFVRFRQPPDVAKIVHSTPLKGGEPLPNSQQPVLATY
jgi:hypothetical protein